MAARLRDRGGVGPPVSLTRQAGNSRSSTAVASAPAEKIAFVSARDGNLENYSVNVDGTDVERLTTSPGNDDEPAWSGAED